MEQSELKISEDLQQLLEFGTTRRFYLAFRFEDDEARELITSHLWIRELIERIATLEAKLATLGRKISDEEMAAALLECPEEGERLSQRFNRILAARVAELSRKPKA